MHLVKGNYGPHMGGPRAQEAPTSARGAAPGGLRSNALLSGGIDDEDDVDGILQQVRKDVKAIQHTAARGRELDGRWCVKGHAVQIVVNDGAVMALGGQPQLITFESPGQFYINDQGTRVDGVLVGTEIHWSDGDVWIAMQEMEGSASSRQPVAGKSLSRNQSDATWDRPKTGTQQEAKTPRAQPKTTVRNRYVFSGGAEAQVLSGLPGQLARPQASSDFGDELASQFSGRKPMAGHQPPRGPHAGHSSSQKQIPQHRDPLPPHPQTPDCTDL